VKEGELMSTPRRYWLLVGILVAFVLGVLFGFILTIAIPEAPARSDINAWLKAFGDIFVRLIRIVIPMLIFFTISAATSSIANARKLGIILLWTLILYIGNITVSRVLGAYRWINIPAWYSYSTSSSSWIYSTQTT